MAIKSLTHIISEEDFLPIAEREAQDFLRIGKFLETIVKKDKGKLDKSAALAKVTTRKFYAYLFLHSDSLEGVLDDYNAKNNRKWFPFRELVAIEKNFSHVGMSLRHILGRLDSYFPLMREEIVSLIQQFRQDSLRVLNFVNNVIYDTFLYIKKECKGLGFRSYRRRGKFIDLESKMEKWVLPFTIKEDGLMEDKSQSAAIRIANEFISLYEQYSKIYFDKRYSIEEIEKIRPSYYGESNLRKFESIAHNLQSDYDTHIKGSEAERTIPHISMLRGYVSVSLHLLEAAVSLAHFYERHILQATLRHLREIISELVPVDELKSNLINYALFYTHSFLEKGVDLADKIINVTVEEDIVELPIPQPQGFHARPCSLIKKIVDYHHCKVVILAHDQRFDASSVIDMLGLGGYVITKRLSTVFFKGEKRCLQDIKILADYNYGDNLSPKRRNMLEEKLPYLSS